jgi:hypothetical protein
MQPHLGLFGSRQLLTQSKISETRFTRVARIGKEHSPRASPVQKAWLAEKHPRGLACKQLRSWLFHSCASWVPGPTLNHPLHASRSEIETLGRSPEDSSI